MTQFDSEESIVIESVEADEPLEVGLPSAPTNETPEVVESVEGEERPVYDDQPLHELLGSVLDSGGSEALAEAPDVFAEDTEDPPEDEAWEELPDTPELQEGYEPETPNEEAKRAAEEDFEVEDFGPIGGGPVIQYYEVQARTHEGEPWETIAHVDPEEELLEVADLPVGETWSFRIRTVFTNGEYSAWSAPSPVIFPEDMLAPGVPSAPIVVGNTAGIGVTWDGLDEDGRPMPPDFARVIIWESRTGEDGTFERRASIPGAMEAILTGSYEIHDEYYYVLTAMDSAGNESGFSEIASGSRLPLTDVTELKGELETLHDTDEALDEAQQELQEAFEAMTERQDEAKTSLEETRERFSSAVIAALELDGLGDFAHIQEEEPAPPPADQPAAWINPATGQRHIYDHDAAAWVPVTAQGLFDEVIARQATIINGAFQRLDVSEKANFVNAFAEQLYADEFTARVANMARATVAAPNLYGNADFHDMTVLGQRWIRVEGLWGYKGAILENDAHTGGRNATDTSDAGTILLGGAPRLSVSARFRADVGASESVTLYVSVVELDGDMSALGTTRALTWESTGPGVETVTAIYEVQNANAVYARLMFGRNYSGMGIVTIGDVLVNDPLDGTLLIDGTIKTRHLENTGDILTDALKARKIEGVDIDGDTFAGNTFRGGLFEGAVVQGGLVQTHAAPSRGVKINDDGVVGYNSSGTPMTRLDATDGTIWSNGGEITGGTITGSLVQSSATANRGIKFDDTGLRAYNASGRETVSVDASNGNVVLDGGDLKAMDITGGSLRIGPRYVGGGSRGIELTNTGIFRAYNSSGDLATVIDGSNNRFTGRVGTGDAGGGEITLVPASSSSGRPRLHISPGGYNPNNNDAGIRVESDWNMALLGRAGSSGRRNRVIVRGGLYVSGSQYDLLSDGKISGSGGLEISGGSGNEISQFWNRVRVSASLHLPNISGTTMAANVGIYSSSTGSGGPYLWRATSVRDMKVNIEDLDWDEDKVLSLRPRTWYDRTEVIDKLGNQEVIPTPDGPQVDEEALKDSNLNRVPGLVAEEVEALGLEGLATYALDEESGELKLQGVAYDRVAVALIPVLRRQRDRVNELESKVEDLEARLAKLEAMLSDD